MRNEKYAYNPYLWPNRRNFRVLQEIRVEEHECDVDFRPEVEIRPFRTCAMKNTQYNPYLCPNCPNCRVF